MSNHRRNIQIRTNIHASPSLGILPGNYEEFQQCIAIIYCLAAEIVETKGRRDYRMTPKWTISQPS